METVFFIGVFKSQSKRLEAECKRRGVRCCQVVADVGKKGILGLLPTPSDAIHAFRDWLRNEDENYDQLHIILLPYCDITDTLYDELLAVVELGAHLTEPEAGKCGWPAAELRRNKFDTPFLNCFFEQLTGLLPQPTVKKEKISVADYYRRVEAETHQVIIEPHLFQICDAVPEFRKDFLKNALDALVELINFTGGCRHEEYFESKGIHHAQSGGITTQLILSDGKSERNLTSNVHLKKGDNTSGSAAVRIYYQLVDNEGMNYLLVFYAGPHPEKDISWNLKLPP